MAYHPRDMRPPHFNPHTFLPPPLLNDHGFIDAGNTATMASNTIPVFATAAPQPAQTVLVYSSAGKPPQTFRPENPLPFEDPTTHSLPSNRNVLIITNVPYTISKAEVQLLLSRHGSPRQSHHEDVVVHIIMERPTGKTMDCFVEVRDKTSVDMTLYHHENLIAQGRPRKVGPRHIGIELSSEDKLLKDLFCRAKNVKWSQGVPVVVPNDDPYSSGFTGFLTGEEMLGMLHHADYPQRSPFAVDCLHRTFECMISTISKFPWYTPELFTLKDRQMLFDAYIGQLVILVGKVGEQKTVGLDYKLLCEFVRAGLKCPGFGPRMKAAIKDVAGKPPPDCYVSDLAFAWPFEVISPKQEADESVTAFYLFLIEGGIQAHLARQQGSMSFPFEDYIDMVLPYKPRPFPFDPKLPHLTKFHFKITGNVLTYDNAVAMESGLMAYFLKLGWDKWQYEHNINARAINAQLDPPARPDLSAAAKRRLGVVDIDPYQVNESAVSALRAVQYQHARADSAAESVESPSQSPKGTIVQDAFPWVTDGLQSLTVEVQSSSNRAVARDPTPASATTSSSNTELRSISTISTETLWHELNARLGSAYTPGTSFSSRGSRLSRRLSSGPLAAVSEDDNEDGEEILLHRGARVNGA